MRRYRAAWSGILVCVLAPNLRAAPPADEVGALAARIDKFIDARLAEEKVAAAPVADDAEFLRRVYLDLTGRIPAVAEVHAFLRDPAKDKRRKLVEDLLRGPNHVSHFTNIWRADLLAAANSQQAQFFAQQLEPWLRKKVRENTPYDVMVRELLTTPVNGNNPRQIGQPVQQGEPTAVAFFQANELKSENLASSTSKLFLGVQLQCAQCHNHPFARWKREQFWEYAAFFVSVQQPQRGVRGPIPVGNGDTTEPRSVKIPETEITVKAKYLDGTEPKWQADLPARATLAQWLTAPENPYFARARVNRLWAQLFGLGMVEPVDDFSDDNPPTHPELLDELARAFVKCKFDTRFLIQAICASKAYQRTSAVSDQGQVDNPRLFGRMSLKGMTAEMLFDSLARATGFVPATDPREANDYNVGRAEFLARFTTTTDKRTEHQTTILQALSLMNGRVIAQVTDLERSRTLAAVIDGPFKDDRERLDALFLATLARPMNEQETTRLTKYVHDGGPSGDSKKALADVFWALLNRTEFALNH